MKKPPLKKMLTCLFEPRTEIESFSRKLIFYNDEAIKYFMLKFPQLKFLGINTNCDYQLRKDIASSSAGVPLSPYIMVGFFKYIKRIPRFGYGNIVIADVEDG
jgi:hypothetical protein